MIIRCEPLNIEMLGYRIDVYCFSVKECVIVNQIDVFNNNFEDLYTTASESLQELIQKFSYIPLRVNSIVDDSYVTESQASREFLEIAVIFKDSHVEFIRDCSNLNVMISIKEHSDLLEELNSLSYFCDFMEI